MMGMLGDLAGRDRLICLSKRKKGRSKEIFFFGDEIGLCANYDLMF
jgi:hypothetical protein